MSTSSSSTPLIIAMDFESASACLTLANSLDPRHCRLKVGKELFTVAGPQLVEQLMSMGFEVFLDLKFHDIPNTVGKAIKAAANLGVWMVNVHASGGERMLLAAREAVEQCDHKPLLIGVTVLTSMTDADLQGVGIQDSATQQVVRLAKLAQQCGLEGVVCSAQEASLLKQQMGSEFLLVTPGIRPADAMGDDQRRVVTPQQALQNGSDYLVVGRPITQAADPAEACRRILQDINDE